MACHQLAIPFRSVPFCTGQGAQPPPASNHQRRAPLADGPARGGQAYKNTARIPYAPVSSFLSVSPLPVLCSSPPLLVAYSWTPPLLPLLLAVACLLACLARPTALPSSSSSLLFPGNGGPGDPRRARMAAAPSRSRGDYDHLIKLLLIGDSGAFPPPSSPDSILRGSGGAATLGLPVRSPD